MCTGVCMCMHVCVEWEKWKDAHQKLKSQLAVDNGGGITDFFLPYMYLYHL